MSKKLSSEEYHRLQLAYDYFNDELFSGQLPQVMLTLQRTRGAMGYAAKRQFVSRDETAEPVHIDEIALNPDCFDTPDIEILQTLVHEMVHIWQFHFGKPGRRGYHNRQWAKKMIEVGLMPSSTGQPGGKQTGESMNDYPIDGGKFQQLAYKLMIGGWTMTWRGLDPWRELARLAAELAATNNTTSDGDGQAEATPPKPRSKAKFSCQPCNQNAWGKPTLKINCGLCGEPMNPIIN